jgi:hypothetical protein
VNPAARVSLAALVRDGSLERVPVDAEVCRNLVRQAVNHLRTAQAGLDSGDVEGGYQLAYDACRKVCLALVLALGLRPVGKGHHVATFEAAAAAAESFQGRAIVDDAADLRHVRHGAEYLAEAIALADAQDSVDVGRELVETIGPQIERVLGQR